MLGGVGGSGHFVQDGRRSGGAAVRRRPELPAAALRHRHDVAGPAGQGARGQGHPLVDHRPRRRRRCPPPPPPHLHPLEGTFAYPFQYSHISDVYYVTTEPARP